MQFSIDSHTLVRFGPRLRCTRAQGIQRYSHVSTDWCRQTIFLWW